MTVASGSGTTSPEAIPSHNPIPLNRHPLANQPDFRQIRRAVELGKISWPIGVHYADIKHDNRRMT
jgi:hypothetical protein